MRSLIPIFLVALLLTACNPYRNQEEEQKRQAEIAAPCIAAVQTLATRDAGPDFRGFKRYDARVVEMAPGNYAVHVRYQEITLTDPSGGAVKRLDCELRGSEVVDVRYPGPI